jgi:hypothetical protein
LFDPLTLSPLYLGLPPHNPYCVGCDFEDALLPTVIEGEPMSLRILNSSSKPNKVLGVWKANSWCALPSALFPLKLWDVL